MSKFYKKSITIENNINDNNKAYIISNIEKDITANDIRARILTIPRAILDLLPEEKNSYDLFFNNNEIKNVRISSDRRYFSQGKKQENIDLKPGFNVIFKIMKNNQEIKF